MHSSLARILLLVCLLPTPSASRRFINRCVGPWLQSVRIGGISGLVAGRGSVALPELCSVILIFMLQCLDFRPVICFTVLLDDANSQHLQTCLPPHFACGVLLLHCSLMGLCLWFAPHVAHSFTRIFLFIAATLPVNA